MTATRTPSAAGPLPPTPPPTPPTPAAPAAPVGGHSRLAPTRDEWSDIAYLGGLTVLGVFGFANAYGGARYLVAGIVGTVLGLLVAYLCARTRQPLLVVIAATVLAFFVFGGAVAVPDEAIAGFLPSIDVVTSLIDGVVEGWRKLLTVLPPAGSGGNLLTIPYVSGLLAGVLSLTIALRSRRPLFAVVPPIVVLILSILFGTSEPASLILQGAVFGTATIAWVATKRRGDRRVGIESRRSRRWAGAATMLLVAGLLALFLGQSLPGADANDRFVLREKTKPPFDPRDYPSPLNGYRKYNDPDLLKETTLFTVSGMSEGERIRLATLDTYDGVVYTVGSGPGSSGYFQQVGDEIPVETPGSRRTITVEVEDYSDVWVPSDGSIASIEFLGSGDRASELQDSFRYNTESGTAAAQAVLQKGDRYRMEVVNPDVEAPTGPAADVSVPAPVFIEEVRTKGAEYDPGAGTAFDRVKGVVARIREDGAFSDGFLEDGQEPSRSGHSAQRLGEMVAPGGVMIGNGEQYAPLTALMANYLGIPARVVMGFQVPSPGPDGTVAVQGQHVDAWIEVAIDGSGWVPIVDLVDKEKPKTEILKEPDPQPQQITPPPPPSSIPPSEEDETDPNKVKPKNDPVDCSEFDGDLEPGTDVPEECKGPGIPWGTIGKVGGIALTPVWVLGAITGSIALLKSRRRARRRGTGRPTDRIAGGWDEVTDLASDLGTPVPVRSTRREAAAFIGNPAAIELARHADGEIFGAGEPDDAGVGRYWDRVEATRDAMVAELTAFEKWKALVSLASLRASGSRRASARRSTRQTRARNAPQRRRGAPSPMASQ